MKKWKTIKEEFVLQGHVFKYWKIHRKSQDSAKEAVFDKFECSDWVNIIAIDKDQNFVMVRQYRHGIDEICVEIAGGAVDKGEDPMDAAKRELAEETGYTSEKWHYLGVVNPNPPLMGNKCFTYLALDAEKTTVQNLDPLEEIDVEIYSKDEIAGLIDSDQINHALVLVGFYYFERWQARQSQN
jgi:ADP-ribose pyrophosphatase